MDIWFQELGKKPAPESLQRDVVTLLRTTAAHTEYADWLKDNTATLGQLTLLSYILNDGLVLMTPTEDEQTEAIHLQNKISDAELKQLKCSCEKSVEEDIKSFEKELHALTLEPELGPDHCRGSIGTGGQLAE